MLNRRHIRIKILQALYSYWSAQGELKVIEVERELKKNLDRFYDLYLYLLLFLKELIQFIEKYDDEMRSRHTPSAREINPNKRLYSNRIANQLLENKTFSSLLDQKMIIWNSDDVDMLRKVFLDLKSNEEYREYIRTEDTNESDDLNIITFIIKQYPVNFSLLEQHLEEKFINWYDDGKVCNQMAIKSLKKIFDAEDDLDFLIPVSTDKKQSYQ